MSEIDATYCKFARLNDVCASPINKQECKCSKIPIQMCYYKQLQQLKQENEELKEQYKLAEPLFQACKIKDLKIDKYKTILDEIEEIAKNGVKDDCGMPLDELSIILKLIKQAKEDGE